MAGLESVGPGGASDAAAINRVVKELLDYEPERIILFGSAAWGDTDQYSDIDLIIIKKTDKRFVQRLVEPGSFVPIDLSVDLFVYTPEEFQSMIDNENPFIEQALKDGKIVYEKTPGNGSPLAGSS